MVWWLLVFFLKINCIEITFENHKYKFDESHANVHHT
jgi:hypothetical protein